MVEKLLHIYKCHIRFAQNSVCSKRHLRFVWQIKFFVYKQTHLLGFQLNFAIQSYSHLIFNISESGICLFNKFIYILHWKISTIFQYSPKNYIFFAWSIFLNIKLSKRATQIKSSQHVWIITNVCNFTWMGEKTTPCNRKWKSDFLRFFLVLF